MKAELKRIHSPDVRNLTSYQPEGPFGVLIQMMVGPEGTLGEEAFDTIVCSPDWLAAHTVLPDLVGDHRIVMNIYDYQKLFRQIQEFCQLQEGNTWQEIALKISKIGKWEFADYKEY